MKLLHTSDWHLGRTLHGVDLSEAQDEFLAGLVRLVGDHAVDCVVVSGDVFDRAIPSTDALRSYERALGQLADLATVVVVAGNHDSAIRLGFTGTLLRPGIHIRTDPTTVDQAIQLHDHHTAVLLYAIPYLDPDHCRHLLSDGDAPLTRSHQAVMAAATARISADRKKAAAANARPVRSVVVAHAFVVGGTSCDSERDIQVGGIASVDPSLFAEHDYVALGHLHRQQFVPGAGNCAYAGSPLRYSFDESADAKSVTLVTLTEAGLSSVEQVDIAQPRPMNTLSDRLDDLLRVDVVERHRDSWLRIEVTDDARPPRLYERIREHYPHALSIQHRPRHLAKLTGVPHQGSGRTPLEVATQFVTEVTNRPTTTAERRVLEDAFASRSTTDRG